MLKLLKLLHSFSYYFEIGEKIWAIKYMAIQFYEKRMLVRGRLRYKKCSAERSSDCNKNLIYLFSQIENEGPIDLYIQMN